MVTGLRVGSLLNAKWSWVQSDVLVIPSKYMKDRKQFRCPLPTQAVTELKLLAKYSVTTNPNDYIFVSPQQDLNKPKSDNTFRNFLRNLLNDNDVTLHGFRTLFNIVLTKSKKFTEERIESQLTHAYTKTAIRRVYLGDEDFLDERRELVQYFSDWADNQAQFYKKAQQVV
jgi:integrase